MSTYEADHNISSSTTDLQQERSHVQQERNQPTLSQSINDFLNSSTRDNTNREHVLQILRENLSHSELDDDQRDNFIQTLTGNNAILDILTNMPEDSMQSKTQGIDDAFLDTLERVSIKKIKPNETCPICTNDYHSDPYPLIVRLPCNDKHFFDLDCIGPWLKLNRTCPLCRVDVTVKKVKEIIPDSEEEEEDWEMYG